MSEAHALPGLSDPSDELLAARHAGVCLPACVDPCASSCDIQSQVMDTTPFPKIRDGWAAQMTRFQPKTGIIVRAQDRHSIQFDYMHWVRRPSLA